MSKTLDKKFAVIEGTMNRTIEIAQASNWDSKLQQQDAIWQKMFNRNPKMNLFPLCLEFFKGVKQEMNDEEFFNQWLKKIKSQYSHRLAYQRINL